MKHTLLVSVALMVSLQAMASPATDEASRLIATDFPAAMAVLEKADAAGDSQASAQLAGTLFFSSAPRMDRPRACAIAQRLAGADNGDGWAMLANCQLTGTVPSADRYAEARESARKSIALGSASGGMTLFNAFQLDPRFSYTGADGRVDARKYDTLAATPVDARTEQAEAWSGLSLALERRDALGAMLAGAALVDTSAPGNQERLLAIAERSPAVARQFAAQVGIARLFKKFGGTHASVKAAVDAHRSAMAAAMLGSEMLGTEKCVKLELARTEPGSAPAEAQYLPVASGPLVNAYLIRGQWQEAWTYHGCGREYAVQVSFTADGWGGVRFQTQYKRS